MSVWQKYTVACKDCPAEFVEDTNTDETACKYHSGGWVEYTDYGDEGNPSSCQEWYWSCCDSYDEKNPGCKGSGGKHTPTPKSLEKATQLAAEVAKVQRERNQSAGYGMVTDDEAEVERKGNAQGKHGAITDAEVLTVLGAAPSADTLAYLLRYLNEGKLDTAAAFVNNKKANWAEALQTQLDAMLPKVDTTKPVAEHIKPLVEMIQKVYTPANLKTLAEAGMKGTLTTIAQQFDAKISSMLLQFANQYAEKVVSSGGAEAIKSRLQEFDDGSDDVRLYSATDSKYRKEGGDAAYRQSGASRAAALKKKFPDAPRQPCSTLLELLVSSSEDEESFKAAVTKMGKEAGAEVKLSDRKGSSLKGLLRLYEKALLKAVILKLDHLDFSMIYDVLRAMLVAPSTGVAAKAQTAVYAGVTLSGSTSVSEVVDELLLPLPPLPPQLLACRSKCRLVGESVTEWRDELINVKHATGKHGLIGEIQIVRSKMLVQRETMGGHDGYDESRSLRGLYDACVASTRGSTGPAKELPTLREMATIPSAAGGASNTELQQCRQTIQTLQLELSATNSEMSAVKLENSKLAAKVERLESDNTTLAAKFERLESDNTTLAATVERLENSAPGKRFDGVGIAIARSVPAAESQRLKTRAKTLSAEVKVQAIFTASCSALAGKKKKNTKLWVVAEMQGDDGALKIFEDSKMKKLPQLTVRLTKVTQVQSVTQKKMWGLIIDQDVAEKQLTLVSDTAGRVKALTTFFVDAGFVVKPAAIAVGGSKAESSSKRWTWRKKTT